MVSTGFTVPVDDVDVPFDVEGALGGGALGGARFQLAGGAGAGRFPSDAELNSLGSVRFLPSGAGKAEVRVKGLGAVVLALEELLPLEVRG